MSAVFDAYSAYYDLLYADKDYSAESDYIAKLIQRHLPGAESVLELGCGTGGHAEHLAGKGYTVSGIDASETMLARARDRKTQLPQDIAQRLSFCPGDVRTWRDDKRFDVVISIFHVFSYQVSNTDLAAAFATAAAQLKPGGILIFDYWYGPAVLTERPEVRIRRIEDKDIRVQRLAEPTLVASENRVQVDYEVRIENKETTQWQTLRESHNMRYLFCPEIDQYAAGQFTVLQHLAWMKDEAPGIEDWAGVSIMKRTQTDLPAG